MLKEKAFWCCALYAPLWASAFGIKADHILESYNIDHLFLYLFTTLQTADTGIIHIDLLHQTALSEVSLTPCYLKSTIISVVPS